MSDAAREQLSPRELELLKDVATGATNQQIAQDLSISVNTVKAHLRNIFAKLDVESRTEATLCAIQLGLISVETPETSDPSHEVESRIAPLPSVRDLDWPLPLSQRLALLLVPVLVLATSLWPGSRAEPPVAASPFVDRPQVSSAGGESGRASMWNQVSQMMTPRSRFAQVEHDGTVFVISGQSPEGWTASVEAYDPVENTWASRAAKPTAVANVGAVAVGGLIYVPGGLDEAGNAQRVLEVYAPGSDSWSTASPLPFPVHSYAIAAVDSHIYLFGGWDGQRYLDTILVYDTSADTWQQQGSLRVARAFAAAAPVGQCIYLVGGYDGHTAYRLCESYDPRAAAMGRDPWRTRAPMSIGRAGHSAIATEGSLYVVGGGLAGYLTHNERYDTANNVWSNFESPYLGEWRTLGLSRIENARTVSLYAMGGWNGDYLATVQTYPIRFNTYLPLQ